MRERHGAKTQNITVIIMYYHHKYFQLRADNGSSFNFAETETCKEQKGTKLLSQVSCSPRLKG
jgi:hypothetical protein